MTKEIRSPNVEESWCAMAVRHSDFGIPADFIIRHSGLKIVDHAELRHPYQRALGPWTGPNPPQPPSVHLLPHWGRRM